jgi:hypothetical protein
MFALVAGGLAVFFLTYQEICVIQAALHRWVGHAGPLTSIRRHHTTSHHSIYGPSRFESTTYSREEKSVSFTYLPIAMLHSALCLLILPVAYAVISIFVCAVTFVAHVYLHEQIHLTGSWLLRSSWFRKIKELHRIHHIDQSKNFGVLDFTWDRITGSYQGLPGKDTPGLS